MLLASLQLVKEQRITCYMLVRSRMLRHPVFVLCSVDLLLFPLEDENQIVPPLDYFDSGGNYSMIKMMTSDAANSRVHPLADFATEEDHEIRIVPPLAYYARGWNYPMIKMMNSESLTFANSMQI